MLRQGAVFGEDFFLKYAPLRRQLTTMSLTFVEVYFLTQGDFFHALRVGSPDDAVKIRKSIVKLAVIRGIMYAAEQISSARGDDFHVNKGGMFNLKTTSESIAASQSKLSAIHRDSDVMASIGLGTDMKPSALKRDADVTASLGLKRAGYGASGGLTGASCGQAAAARSPVNDVAPTAARGTTRATTRASIGGLHGLMGSVQAARKSVCQSAIAGVGRASVAPPSTVFEEASQSHPMGGAFPMTGVYAESSSSSSLMYTMMARLHDIHEMVEQTSMINTNHAAQIDMLEDQLQEVTDMLDRSVTLHRPSHIVRERESGYAHAQFRMVQDQENRHFDGVTSLSAVNEEVCV